ncbi:(deoxy)nucleoside triphosphate pyrophosphohydrolase [Clostridium botulinum]|uniref:8-oxo-dGTP diphosphatase n=1 Tax=Clostridium botulinum D str. 1873 TaxID=592027 RepID=A0A9P2G6G3_CLOBO|nr:MULTISPECIES: (deoxy)nucleoside triphosphate pyrophosphohydrolase [Clostridium]AYF54882.1 (deoxy)nucleoside triphosphate pyrophosphohydrolase [Clostridium novyi]EES90779.1 7,8-dihydro-8-oxoguanine-triphosphatase [Clostridium botulinum D str. 1873]MBO3442686.1 (deoxy)nucleoside triphosphate pyrophosphohydrolase [Clostridium haemolyticum]NFV48282.1 (deoxy)nucleoside triphosphate pyrophosphohydrolase [Clostridium botulinum]
MKKLIKVVGAIIENNNNEILCALRSPKMSIPNIWEFPGGKIEQGETLKEAIEREIKEELDCYVEFIEEFNNNIHEYDNFIVNLITVKCNLVKGTPTANEHSKLIWLNRENLSSLKWAPADIPAMEQLSVEKV